MQDRHSLEDALAEVTERLARHSQMRRPKEGCDFDRLVLEVPVGRAEIRRSYVFCERPRSEVMACWDYIWRHAAWFEVMHQALYYYQLHEPNRREARIICAWSDRCQCWEHCDDLAKILAGIVEAHPAWILPTLRRWNRAANPWQRRLSVVSLIEYARKRQRVLPYDVLIGFVDNLLADDDYYVQKAVGWTLREIYNVYPEQALAYLTTNIGRIPPAGYSAATGKLDGAKRARLKRLRISSRQSGT